MRGEIVYSANNEFKKASSEIVKKIEELKLSKFKPNFLLLFLTDGTFKDYKKYNELFRRYFPDVQMVGCIVEGYIVKDSIWTRGVAALLGEFEGEVRVFWESGRDVERVCGRLGERIGDKWDTILIMFPAFYFPGRLEFVRLFLNDKLYYRNYRSKKTVEEKKEVLREYSRYLEDNFIFPIDKVLKILADKTGGNTPIVGMNLMPLEAKVGTPIILANYEDVGRGVAALCFKGEVNAIYHDVFPERGSNFEETVEIIKNYFSNVEEVEAVKADIAIGEINGIRPMEFLKLKKRGFDEVSEDEFINKVERGKLQVASPYVVAFISKINSGVSLLGLVNSPVNIYPSPSTLEIFFDKCFFLGETFKGGPTKFIKVFDKKIYNGFDFYILDMSAILAFGGEVHKILQRIDDHSKSAFGIFSTPPSMFVTYEKSRHLSDIGDKICFTTSGSTAVIEFKTSLE